jgi:hypothetical protein
MTIVKYIIVSTRISEIRPSEEVDDNVVAHLPRCIASENV